MKTLKKVFAAAIVAVMVLSLAACTGFGGSRGNTVNIQNLLGIDIQELYISPSTEDTWGEDLLGGETMRTGGIAELQLASAQNNTYDIQLRDSHGYIWKFMNVELANGAEAKLKVEDGTPYCSVTNGRNSVDFAGTSDSDILVPAGPGELTLTNASGYNLWSGYISPSTSDEWGRDVFGSNTCSDGETIDIDFDQDSSGVYDIKFYDMNDGLYWIFSSVTLASGDALTVSLDESGFPALSVNGYGYTGYATTNENGSRDDSDGTMPVVPVTPTATGEGSLTLVNHSGHYFYSGRIAPAATTISEWGRDVFGAHTSSDGDTIDLTYDTFESGIYAVKLYASHDSNYWVFQNVSLTPGATLTVTTGSGGFPALDVNGTSYTGYITVNEDGTADGSSGQAGSGPATLVNSSGYNMWSGYISLSTDDSWGSDVFGSSTCSNGETIELRFTGDGSTYDIKLYSSQLGNYWIFPEVTIGDGAILTLLVDSSGYPVMNVDGTPYVGYVTTNESGAADGSSGTVSGGGSAPSGGTAGHINSAGHYEVDLTLYNVGSTDVWYFRCSSVTDTSWGSDHLGSNVLNAGTYLENITVEGSDSNTRFDMAFAPSDNSTFYCAYDVDLGTATTIVVDIDAGTMATAASYSDAVAGNWENSYTLQTESH